MKDDRVYLYHMLERCRRVARLISTGKDAFIASEDLQDAVIRNIEVIGEPRSECQHRMPCGQHC